MTTAAPAVSRELAERVREPGADMLDAPVSGSVSTLEEGRLSIMVGGQRGDVPSASSRSCSTSARR